MKDTLESEIVCTGQQRIAELLEKAKSGQYVVPDASFSGCKFRIPAGVILNLAKSGKKCYVLFMRRNFGNRIFRRVPDNTPTVSALPAKLIGN